MIERATSPASGQSSEFNPLRAVGMPLIGQFGHSLGALWSNHA